MSGVGWLIIAGLRHEGAGALDNGRTSGFCLTSVFL